MAAWANAPAGGLGVGALFAVGGDGVGVVCCNCCCGGTGEAFLLETGVVGLLPAGVLALLGEGLIPIRANAAAVGSTAGGDARLPLEDVLGAGGLEAGLFVAPLALDRVAAAGADERGGGPPDDGAFVPLVVEGAEGGCNVGAGVEDMLSRPANGSAGSN